MKLKNTEKVIGTGNIKKIFTLGMVCCLLTGCGNMIPELTEEEELVVRILMRQGDLHINALVVEADIPVNRMSALLFELEMKGVVKAMVGGVYHLLA